MWKINIFIECLLCECSFRAQDKQKSKKSMQIIKTVSRFVVDYSIKWAVGWEARMAQLEEVYSKDCEDLRTSEKLNREEERAC